MKYPMQRRLEARATPQFERVSDIDQQRIVDHPGIAPDSPLERFRRRQDLQTLAAVLALEQQRERPIARVGARAIRFDVRAAWDGGIVQEAQDGTRVGTFMVL